jgi:MFS family permease
MTDTVIDSTRRDVEVIALVSTAHGFSHFYQLVLPPLFPFITAEFGIGYGEMGLTTALFYATSGLAQTPAGFLVDRLGARRVLLGGLGLAALSAGLMSLVPSFWMMLPLVMLAGLGNSVFHPADYAILTHTVTPKRMARAYGAHTLSGNIGWTAAPVTMLGLASALGWRGALAAAGVLGIAVVLAYAGRSSVLHVERMARKPAAATSDGRRIPYLALLAAPAILLCFAYFVLLSVALVGNQTFMPTALYKLYGTPLATANLALTMYLLAGSLGVLAGGIAADRYRRHERIVALGLLLAAALMITIGAVALPDPAIVACVALAGFASGTTTPSRDMLVRGAAPAGATGKVFGFVYSGLDLGSAVTPPVLGWFLDRDAPQMVFVLSAAALVLTVATVLGLKRNMNARAAAAAE